MYRFVMTLSFATLFAAACSFKPPEAGDEGIAACPDAPAVNCNNAEALCTVDDARACRVCRCPGSAAVPAASTMSGWENHPPMGNFPLPAGPR
jgi:hypothetical protein